MALTLGVGCEAAPTKQPSPNVAPTANAGPAQTVSAGSFVTLDGSGSSDPDGDPLTFRWLFVSSPAHSHASLTGPTSAAPGFTADLAGNYVVMLVVNDGKTDSTATTVTITALEAATCMTGESRACNTGVPGICAAGTQLCTDGSFGACTAGVLPSTEVCGDSLDNDCDGTIDNGCVCTSGESRGCASGLLGICAAGTQSCKSDGKGYGDCVATSSPATETCDDGLDNDCDGDIDEGCTCVANSSASCVAGLGICAAGTHVCNPDGVGYGPCVATSSPGVEACGDALDSDCDGDPDNGCVCTAAAESGCVSGFDGACSAGTHTCNSDGKGFGFCFATLAPATEVCGDGLDNDCDGEVDNGCCVPSATTACATGFHGVCAAGTHTCTPDGRGYTPCFATVQQTNEVCGDGLDNDCDDTVDNGCLCVAGTKQSCVTTLVGACAAGTHTCNPDGRSFGPCTATPSPEVCGDGIDNDCDGDVDDGCACLAGTSQGCDSGQPGRCAAGVHQCKADGSGYGACVPTNAAVTEVCGDGIDNNCDGAVDEGCACVANSQHPCVAGLGFCATGTMTCNVDGVGYGPCESSLPPTEETCGDGVDNDCDGAIDNSCICTPGTVACATGLYGICAAGKRMCFGSGYTDCVQDLPDLLETCGNGLDDDCDGQIDNGCLCVAGSTRLCMTTDSSFCPVGSQKCNAFGSGYGDCTGLPPIIETCGDGLDNDCNGAIDDVCVCTPGAIRDCFTGMHGICAHGKQTCDELGNTYGPCEGLPPVVEECDGLDNDCDGAIDDEGCP